jgi:hypothetical protein
MRKGAQELKDLDVDRVDAVDKPATGRNFLLFKSEDGDQIMKGYGMTATALGLVLKAIRKDKHAVVSRKTAIALNGAAQVLGQDAVFVGKSVPTQPYMFTEPDADRRGPVDENLGGNFTPRAMPGSMVGSVQFRMKDDDEDEDDDEDDAKHKAAYDEDDDEDDAKGKGKRKARKDEFTRGDNAEGKASRTQSGPTRLRKDDDEDEDDAKRKASRKAATRKDDDDDDDDDDMDASERTNRGVARSLKAQSKSIEALTGLIAKAMGLEPVDVRKDEGDDVQPVRRPRSRQVQSDEPVSVRKGEFADTRMGTSFANVVFGQQGR